MIRAQIIDSDGRWQLIIDGHAHSEMCAVITAVEQTVAIQLSRLAELNPSALTFTYCQEATP